MNLTGKTIWRVRITPNQLLDRGCNHMTDYFDPPTPGCRSCSVNAELRDSGMEMQIANAYDSGYRDVSGEATTEEQKRAVSRLIAWAYGHIDPLDIA